MCSCPCPNTVDLKYNPTFLKIDLEMFIVIAMQLKLEIGGTEVQKAAGPNW
jgi:hypothetical protein